MKKTKEPDGKYLFVPELKLSQIDKIEWSEIPYLYNSKDAVSILQHYIAEKELGNQINVNEFTFIIFLNKRNKVIAITNHSIGGIDGTVMDLRLMFAQGVLVGAAAMVVAHNHPSGNLNPSEADKKMAQKLGQAAKIMEMPILDFLIITSNSGYTSFQDDGISLSYAKGGEIAHPNIKWSEYYEHGGTVSDMPPKDENGKLKIDRKSIERLTDYVISLPQTKSMYFNEATGQYSPERKRLHAEIINSYKKDVVCITEGKPIAILMGGSPASGKSSFLRKYSPYLLQDEILRVDADDIRAKLPEYKGYNATQTHLETKDIVNTLISDRVIGIPCDFDLIYDGTMNSIKSYLPLIDTLKKRGYLIFIVYMDKVPKDVVIDRILKRYQKTGRFVPLEVVEDFYRKGRLAFEQLKNKVDGYMVIDGNSFDYPIIEQGGMELPQERAYSMLGYPIPKETLPKEYAKGGRTGYERLVKKVAANYEGKAVPSKYQSKYGKRYDADEAKKVGYAVATKVYGKPMARMAEGGGIGGTIQGLNADEFAYLYIKRGIKSPFREEYLKPIGLWKTAKAQEIEKSLIAKGLLNSAGAITEAGKTLAKQIDTEIQSAFSGGYIGSMTSNRVDKFNNVKEKFSSYAKGGKFHLGGDMSKHLAPNGKPSNLTHEQWHLVRTPEFKAWFGDWEEAYRTGNYEGVSKVLNENGEPLVVYHGTTQDFNVFYSGSFFTDDYMNADGYASGEIILEVFLNIKKPLIINARGRKWDNLKNKYGSSTREIVSKLDEEKYDGVFFNRINDNWFDDEMGSPQNVYYSIKPTQIKLADGTNTTFDGSNPDIRFAEGGEINKFDSRGLLTDEYIKQECEQKAQEVSDVFLANHYGENIGKLKPYHLDNLRQAYYYECLASAQENELSINQRNEEWSERGVDAMLGYLDEDRGDRADDEIKKDFMYSANRYAKRRILDKNRFAEGGEISKEVSVLLEQLGRAHELENNDLFDEIHDKIHIISDNQGLTENEYAIWDNLREQNNEQRLKAYLNNALLKMKEPPRYAEGGEIDDLITAEDRMTARQHTIKLPL